MAEIPDVIPSTPIETDWGNTIRDRTTMRYDNAAARDASVTIPVPGDLAFLEDVAEITVYNGAAWTSLFYTTNDQLLGPGFLELERTGSGMIVARRDTGNPASSGTRFSLQVSDGFLLQIASFDNVTWPETTIMKGRNAGVPQAQFPNGVGNTPGVAFLTSPQTGMSYENSILGHSDLGNQLYHAAWNSGSPYFRLNGSVTDVRFQGAANFASTGVVSNVAIPDLANGLWRQITSARRFKSQIEPAPDLAEIALEPVSFYREDDDETLYGFIADDLAVQDARLGRYDADGEVLNYDDRGLAAILAAKVNDLEARVAELETRLALTEE